MPSRDLSDDFARVYRTTIERPERKGLTNWVGASHAAVTPETYVCLSAEAVRLELTTAAPGGLFQLVLSS